MSGLNGLDLILLVAFFYVSYKLYKRAKKEGNKWPYIQKNMNLLNGVN